MELNDLRTDYGKDRITDKGLPPDPTEWLNRWLNEAIAWGIPEPNAMALSTVSENGCPSSRIVLLKSYDDKGFVFFTNYESRKGVHLTANPQASLLFFWPALERQVRIEGVVEILEHETSDAYFMSRPVDSRISAFISPQSRVVESREALETMHQEFKSQYPDGPVQRPEHWGGYRLIPRIVEFWQGRSNRLHDRIQYERDGFFWKRSRLAP